LHDRIKDELKRKKGCDNLNLVIVFGKNENDFSKSISAEDISFLKDFPNVLICYEKNLHAKYYASEDFSLITSMNLHEFSQNKNVEVAVLMKPKNAIKKLANWVIEETDLGTNAQNYFEEVIDHSKILFKKVPQYESSLLGLKRSYTNSVLEIDRTEEFFRGQKGNVVEKQNRKIEEKKFTPGFCIRTGKPIPFDQKRPMSIDAWKEWNKTKDVNSRENFCHYSGEPSNGETTYSKPILRKNWGKLKRSY
jgi:hypothetical protein